MIASRRIRRKSCHTKIYGLGLQLGQYAVEINGNDFQPSPM